MKINYFFAALLGGAASVMFFPMISYFFVRFFNWIFVNVQIEAHGGNSDNRYVIHSLRIKNNTLSSLKNVIAFIIIEYNSEDIASDNEIQTYTAVTPGRPLMLSWAKVTQDRNLPNIDINQGETADLNVIRYHQHTLLPSIQISSEQGFYNDKWQNKGRVLLKAHRAYNLTILITADNIFPVKKKIIFDQLTASMSFA